MPQTVVEKIAQTHLAEGPDRPLRAGDFVSIRPRHVMTHDNTSAVLSKFKAIGASHICDPAQPVFALDHDIQNREEANLKKYRAIEAFAREHGIDFYPAGTGIGHQIMVERGYVFPGAFVVASDSHSNMYGALGAVGTPIVRTDAAAVWATGEFWWQVPRSIKVGLEGKLQSGVSGKDVIITLCGLYNHDETLNAAIEFSGPGISSLTVEDRLAIANMSTEWGPLVAWFPVDDLTIAYLRGIREQWKGGVQRFTESDIAHWAANPLRPDPGAHYAAEIVLDLNRVTPHVAGPDTVQVMHQLGEIETKRIAVQKAYLISCANARLEDLQSAAFVLQGKRIAPSVKLYVSAASARVQQDAERKGIWQTLLDAGASPLPPGCGPCIGLGKGLLEKGEVGISATNRNFKGRMGSRDAQCYLASPAVVAASAVAGYITAPNRIHDRTPDRHFTQFSINGDASKEKVAILPGFPDHVRGRLVFLPQDNLNTDAIYGKDYTYRDDMTPDMMAAVVMENYDPKFASRASAGDVIVGGFNFGTGSSREQAVTCLKAKGIPLVIAASFSQTYLRNAYNNGFLCIEVPELIQRLRDEFAQECAAGQRTIIPGNQIEIHFTTGTIEWQDRRFSFPPLGTVPQSLVIAGGVENLVARKLGLSVLKNQPEPVATP